MVADRSLCAGGGIGTSRVAGVAGISAAGPVHSSPGDLSRGAVAFSLTWLGADCAQRPAGRIAVRRHAGRPVHCQGEKMPEPSARQDATAHQVVDAAFVVHTALGPGLLESVYADCLACELAMRNIPVQRQVAVPVHYRTLCLDGGFRIDMVVEGWVVVEIKAVERLLPVHRAQLLTYLKLSGHRLGLLINFNVALIKHGIIRMIGTP